MVSVSSTAIADLDYDEQGETLVITFTDGTRYLYSGVGQSEYAALVYAMSHGTHFNFNLRRGNQSYRRLS